MALRNPAAVVVLLLALLLISDFASAASGGQSGGNVFPSGGGSSSSGSSGGGSGSSGSWSGGGSGSGSGFLGLRGTLILIAVVVGAVVVISYCGTKTSVVKLQVGLVGKARLLQKDLNRLTETTDMSTAVGLSHLLTGASTSLLRNLDYCISSYSSVTRKSKAEAAEQCFKQLSMEEAAKFNQVTLSNVNNFIVRSTSKTPNEGHKEYIVVTILVATQEALNFPRINGPSDLKNALESLGSIPSNKIFAVEVLWTPQQENDTLTQKELLKDYPQLRGFYDEGPLHEGPYDDTHPFLGVTVVKN